MSQVKNVTRFVAAIVLVAGFAFVVPPANAAEDADVEQPSLSTTQTIPPCAATPEPGAGPATVGTNDFCDPWVEIETDAADCRAETDRPDANVSCETALSSVQLALSPSDADPTERCTIEETDDGIVYVACQLTSSNDQACIQVYWKVEAGPVTWERSGCDGEVTVDDDWRALSELDSTSNCFHIYWKHEVGPVVWEQRSSCDGEIYFDEEWQP